MRRLIPLIFSALLVMSGRQLMLRNQIMFFGEKMHRALKTYDQKATFMKN